MYLGGGDAHRSRPQHSPNALKVTPTGSYSVCLTFLVRNNNLYFLIDVFRDRVDFPQLCQQVVALAAKHRPDAILIEDKGSGSRSYRHSRITEFKGSFPLGRRTARLLAFIAKPPSLRRAPSTFRPTKESGSPT